MKLLQIKQQSGSALVVALTILLVLTILGVSAMRNTALQDKMAGNARDAQTAFEAAEFALRLGEQELETNVVSVGSFVGGAYHNFRGLGAEAWTSEANWAAANNAVTYPGYAGGDVSAAPQYMIQRVDAKVPIEQSPETGGGYGIDDFVGLNVYQITARGYGISPNSRVMLQSYYRE